jgi:hypothetical protein
MTNLIQAMMRKRVIITGFLGGSERARVTVETVVTRARVVATQGSPGS